MRLAPLLLCEKTGGWAAAVGAQVVDASNASLLRVIETRSFAECRKCFSAGDGAAAVLVVEANSSTVGEALDLLVEHLRRRPRVPRFVVGPALPADYEPLVREAGGLAWITSPRALRPLVETLRRYDPTTAIAAGCDEPNVPPAEKFYASLPWRRPR